MKHLDPRGLVLCGLMLAMACEGRLQFDPGVGDAAARPRTAGSGGNPGTPGAGSGGAGTGGVTGGSGGVGMGTGGEPGYPMTDAGAAEDVWPPGTGGAAGAPMSGGGGDGGVTPADTGMAPVASACPQGFDILDMFNRKCGGCHGATAPTKNLDLVTAGIGGRMVNKLSTCMGKPLISSQLGAGGKPVGLLFDKLAGAVTGCGVRMPAGGSPALTAVEMECVNDWAVGAINKALGK